VLLLQYVQKQLEQGQQQAGKVSGTKKKHLEEHGAAS